MNNKFTIEICSDLDYEEMVADIYYDEHAVTMVTQEKGVNNMEIEIFAPAKEITSFKFSLDEFVESILAAKKRLIEMQTREPSDDIESPM